MRRILHRGTTFGCALALLMCAAAWLASAASASDSIYWTSYTNSGAVRVGDLGGSGARDLFTGESSPEGVAIDAAAGTIYWADTTSGAIRVANLDGTGARDLYTGESQPSGVAIDPAAGLIYWADAVSGSGAIRVGNLDGSGARTLFAGESYPVGVAIDPAAGKIYWGSYDTFKIRVGNLDGTGATGPVHRRELSHRVGDRSRRGKALLDQRVRRQRPGGEPRRYGRHEPVHGRGRHRGPRDRSDGREDLLEQLESRRTVRVGSLDGTAPAQSLYTGETEPWFVALLRAPLGTGSPQVSGGGGVGQSLSCSPGSWASDLLERFPVPRAAERRVSVDRRWRADRRRHDELRARELARRVPVRGDRHQRRRLDLADERSHGHFGGSLPAPRLGRTENVAPVNGKVFVLINGRLVPLTGGDADPVRHRGRRAPRDAVADHRHREQEEDADRNVRRCGLQGHAGESWQEQGADDADAGQQRVQGRPVVRHVQGAQGARCIGGRDLEPDAPAPSRQRPREVPHQRPLQRRHGARHQMDDRGPLRWHAHPRHHRLGSGHRLRPTQDDRLARRADVSRQGNPPGQIASRTRLDSW